MRTLVLIALALAPALALVPTASAHITDFSQAKALSIGPYNVLMTPKPSPMFANTALSMNAVFAKADDGSYVTSGIAPTLLLIDQNGSKSSTKMEADGQGHYLASVAVTKPGNYTARLVVNATGGPFSNETSFFVYPEIGLRFRTDDPKQSDPTVGQDYTFGIDSYDPDTLLPKDPPAKDLKIVLEHWTDDHVTLLGSESFDMTHAGTGRWTLRHTFTERGMYHLRFASASGGFKPDDVPILHTTANDAVTPTGGNKVPAAPAALAIALVAAAAVAIARRRR